MSGKEIVKFAVIQLVEYMETPKEVRQIAKQKAKATREPWLTRWFGVGGAGILLWLKKRS